MAGLYRLWVEEKIEIVNFWDTSHCIEKDEDAMRTGEVNHNVWDWRTYQRLRQSVRNPTVLRLTHGAMGDFFTADGISIWAPFDHSQTMNAGADPNDLSYLLRIEVGKCNIIIGGDATIDTWETLYKRYKSFRRSICLRHLITVARAAPHGVRKIDESRPNNPFSGRIES